MATQKKGPSAVEEQSRNRLNGDRQKAYSGEMGMRSSDISPSWSRHAVDTPEALFKLRRQNGAALAVEAAMEYDLRSRKAGYPERKLEVALREMGGEMDAYADRLKAVFEAVSGLAGSTPHLSSIPPVFEPVADLFALLKEIDRALPDKQSEAAQLTEQVDQLAIDSKLRAASRGAPGSMSRNAPLR